MSAPLFDVVIPCHGRADWLELCLAALHNFTKNEIRILVVDNASPDAASKKLFERVKAGEFGDGHVIHLAKNQSFSNACNAGIQAGKAPNVVILNSDAIVTPGWDTHFAQDLADKKVGISGARSNAASGLQSDSTGLASVVDAKVLVFVCVAFRREIYDTVGPLDETTFDGFSCEDLDMSWRVRWGVPKGVDPKVTLAENHGPRFILRVSNAYVMHGLSQTLTAVVGDAAARARNDLKYQIRLAEKWGMDFVNEQCVATPRVLIVSFHAEEWTRVDFHASMMGLRKGTAWDFDYVAIRRLPIHLARQTAAEAAIKHGFQYMVMIDDDHEFPNDLIHRLMAHKKDVVCALAYGRKPPHTTCVYSLGEDGKSGNSMPGIENTGLRKVDISGFAVSCFDLEIFRKMRAGGDKKWFGNFDEMGEDFFMSHRLMKHKIPLYVDTDLVVPHLGDAIRVDTAYKKAFEARTGLRT